MKLKLNGFIGKSLISLLIGGLFTGMYNSLPVYASNIGVYGGAQSLLREAIEIIENGTGEFDPVADESVDITFDPTELQGNFLNGISIGNIDLSGKTYDEAISAINQYVNNASNTTITFNSLDNTTVDVTLGQLGVYWDDEASVIEALKLGKEGNIVDRYKARKDVEHDKVSYPLALKYNQAYISGIVEEQAAKYNILGEPASLTKTDDGFSITPGVAGESINIKSSIAKINSMLENFDGNPMKIDLDIEVNNPEAQIAELEKIKDVIGTYTTSFSSSSSDRSGNVRNGTSLVNGTLLYPGEQFSMYETVSPFTEENGYFLAGSYSNGMVVESFGGGICQVSSTLYNAVLRAELEVVERYNHSMIVTYVDLSSDAAISGTSKDFKFVNNKEYPIYIEGYTTDDKKVVFNIYGIEDRPANREVIYESVKISETVPEGERVVADSSSRLGSVSVQSAHTGYVGELWKVVKIDGVEVERTQVNKSTYHPSPKTASVGTATDNPTALAIVQAAIATGSIDYVKSVINQLNTAAATQTPVIIPDVPASTTVVTEQAVPEVSVPEITLPESDNDTNYDTQPESDNSGDDSAESGDDEDI